MKIEGFYGNARFSRVGFFADDEEGQCFIVRVFAQQRTLKQKKTNNFPRFEFIT